MDAHLEETTNRLGNVSISEKCQPLKEIQLNQLDGKSDNTPQKPVHRTYEGSVSDSPAIKEKRTASASEISEEDQMKFNKLIMKSKQLAGEGNVSRALEMNKRALKIYHSEKLLKRIEKMEAYLKECEEKSSEEEDDGMVHIGSGFYLYKDLSEKLYSHQKEGLLWFWSLFKKRKGGILGDDMGLGKTIQVISFLSGMFDSDKVNAVLIVMPVSIMPNWEKEFKKWAPGIRVNTFHGSSKKERERCLLKVQRRGGVCLTTYGLVVTSWEQLGQQNGREFVWDYLILDEGHKIKNPTKTTKGVHAVPAKNRIILTGTPIQNNLRELWSLFDFVHDGALLGTARTFKMEYENPITRSRERDATAGEKRLGSEMAESLKRIIAPYFLRRTKAEVTEKNKHDRKSQDELKKNETKQMPSFTRKNDLIVWVFLTEKQQSIYQDFLDLDSVKELLMTTKSPLVALTVLKKICDHPRLLSQRACAQLGLDGQDRIDDSMLDCAAGQESAATKVEDIPDELLISESGKISVVIELLENLKSEGHRCLIFSQSRKLLDILQKVLKNMGHKIMRMDGTIRELCERDKRIKKFQSDPTYNIFLLTTQVGGVGLTLTAADRVIIYDPSWNPATDAQAVDRVFRIGQEKDVVIYRLITCGSIEEKIYRRQIFKDSITKQTTGQSKNPYRYFSKQELRELFTLSNPRISTTQQQLQELHSNHRKSDTKLDSHIAFLHSLEIFGVSDHDLMFSKDSAHQDLEEDEAEYGSEYIQSRVKKAQDLISLESTLPSQMRDREIPSRSSDPLRQPYKPSDNRPPFPNSDDVPQVSPSYPKTENDTWAHHNEMQVENNNEVVQKTRIKSEETVDITSEIFDESEVIDLNSSSEVSEEDQQPVIKLEKSLHEVPVHLPQKVKQEPGVPMQQNILNSYIKQEPPENALLNHGSEVSVKKEPDEPRMDSPLKIKEESDGSDRQLNNQAFQSPFSCVSQSPHVINISPRKTPISLKKKKIVQEEILISPDAGSPVIMMKRKSIGKQNRNSTSNDCRPLSTPVRQMNKAHLNSTLFMSDTPKTDFNCNATIIQDSPSPSVSRIPKKAVNLYTTIIEDSPEKSFRKDELHNNSNVCIADSVQNTPEATYEKFSSIPDDSMVEESICEEQEDGNMSKLGSTEGKKDSICDESDLEYREAKEDSSCEFGSTDKKAVEDSVCDESKAENIDDTCEVSNVGNNSMENGVCDESDLDNSKMEDGSICKQSNDHSKEKEDESFNANRSAEHSTIENSVCDESSTEELEEADSNRKNRKGVDSEEKYSGLNEQSSDASFADSDSNSGSPVVVKKSRRRSTYKKTLESSSDEEDRSGEDSCDMENQSVDCDNTVASDEDGETSRHSEEEGSEEDTDLSGFIASDSGDEEEYESSFEDEDSEEESDENSEDDDGPPEHLEEEFNQHISETKKMYKAKRYEEALAAVLKALDIHPAQELQAMALKIHGKISS